MSETPDARALKSIAFMLGWQNVPPQETLERDLNALRSRMETAERERDEARAERDLALAAMKRLPEHLKECQGNGDDDPPCVALLAYEEAGQREAALREALEGLVGDHGAFYFNGLLVADHCWCAHKAEPALEADSHEAGCPARALIEARAALAPSSEAE